MLQVFLKINNILKYVAIVIFLMSCKKADIDVTFFKNSNSKKSLNATITNVQIINDQIVITGTNLNNVTSLKMKEGAVETSFQIESKNSTTITANSLSNISVATGKVLSFILANANAAATFNVNFSLCDSLLGGKGFACNITPNDKEVLSYDAATGLWKPRAVNGLNYVGTWDALPGNPPALQPAGSYYVISNAGTIGGINFNVGDWIVSNGTVYQKIENSNDVTSVHGRTGAVVSSEGDYSLDQLGDVDLTVAANVGEFLKFDGTKWVAGNVAGSAGGTVTNVSGTTPIQVTNGTTAPVVSISQATSTTNGYLSSTDWTNFNNKEAALPTGGTALQYLRGDKTLATLDTSAVAENTNLYFTNARVLGVPLTGFSPVNSAIVDTDSILQGFNKTQGQLNAKADTTNIAQNITALSVTGLTTPSAGSDAANKAYVDSAIAGATAGAWSENGGNVFRPTGNVGIGTNTPNYDLTFDGDSAKELGMQRNTAPNSAGQSLKIISGGASAGATDRSGGDLIFTTGVSTGNSSSRILLQTSPQGTAGTTDNNPATRMEIDGYGRTKITSVDPNISGNNSPILNLKNIHTQFELGHYGGISRFAVGAASGVSETTLYMTGITGVSSDIAGFNIQTDSFEISNNGTRTFNVNSGGNVGIGNTNNVAKLDVLGAIKFGTDASGCSALRAGTMRFPSPHFEYCDGSNWQSLATAGSIQNTILSAFALDAGTKPSVTNTDSIVSAFGKVQKTLNDINSDYVSKSANQVINGTLAINSVTGFITVPTPLTANDAVNKAYVDGFGQWLENGSDIYFNTGNVGIGVSTPSNKLTIGPNLGTGFALTANSDSSPYGAVVQTSEAAPTSNPTFWVRTTPDGGTTTNTLFRVQNNGFIGINNGSPSTHLDVTGTVNATNFSITGGNGKQVILKSYQDAGGNGSVYIGNNSGGSSSTGHTNFFNTVVGHMSLSNNSSGSGNTVLGMHAFNQGTSGGYNTVIGTFAGQRIIGDDNVLLGRSAGQGAVGANINGNTIIGTNAGNSITSGGNNIIIGNNAATNITTGSRNIVIGHNIQIQNPTNTNSLNIGNLLFGTNLNGTGSTISAGSIGIGTASPGGMLEIMRPTADSGVILKLGDANFGFEFSREHATSGALRIQGNQPTYANILLAPTSGKVGIGIGATTIPAAKLDVGGEIKLGNTSSTCSASTEGQQRYNSTLKIMEFCNGTAWTSMSAGGGGSGLGVGQTWQDMTGSRSLGTTYTNSTGKPIMIQILGYSGGAGGGYVYASVGGSANFPIGNWYSAGGSYPINGTLVVPDGATYVINYSITAGSPSYNQWFELR